MADILKCTAHLHSCSKLSPDNWHIRTDIITDITAISRTIRAYRDRLHITLKFCHKVRQNPRVGKRFSQKKKNGCVYSPTNASKVNNRRFQPVFRVGKQILNPVRLCADFPVSDV